MKSVKVILCSMILIFACSLSTYAKATDSNATDSNAIEENNIVLTVDETSGIYGSSLDEIFTGASKYSARPPVLSNVSISNSMNEIVFQGTLSCEGRVFSINSTGDLYKNEKTSNSGMHGNIILADMEDTEEVHFVQFRFDRRNSELLIIMQFIESRELLSFTISLNTNIFNNIDALSENIIDDEELENKIVELYSISRNLLDVDERTDVYRLKSSTFNSYTPMAIDEGNYTEWMNFFDDLSDGTVKLNDYPNDMASMFKGHGVSTDNEWNYPYATTSYSYQNGPDAYLTQVSFLDIVMQGYPIHSDKYELALQLKYREGAVVEYDSITDTLTVLYYNFGVRLTDVQVGIGELTNSFFINRKVSRRYEESGNLVRAFLALYAPADAALGVLEGLSMGTNQSASETEYFEENVDGQMVKYQGKIVKGIVASSEENSLTKPGHMLNVAGTMKPITSGSYTWKMEYVFTAQSYI